MGIISLRSMPTEMYEYSESLILPTLVLVVCVPAYIVVNKFRLASPGREVWDQECKFLGLAMFNWLLPIVWRNGFNEYSKQL